MQNDDMVSKNIKGRLFQPPPGSFFLLGARGTGKTTWLRQSLADAHFIDLLDEQRYLGYLTDPGRFAAELRSLEPHRTVVVDEVQRLPQLLNEVHRAMEELGLTFVLCGSSARKLKAGGVNLLAGRAARREMHPFTPEELGDDFQLDDALRWGTLPVVLGAADRRDALDAYVQLYLKAEIQAEALVRNLAGFARFLPIAALFHGQAVNVSGIARDAGVARTTAAGYLEILEDTLLAFRLPAFTPRLRVRERRHPKLYWIDPGLVRAVNRRVGPPVGDEAGHLLEGFVASTLRAYRDNRGLFDDWSYWAPSAARSTEVDFLLRRGDALVAIEVKATASQPRNKELRGLRAVAELEGMRRRMVVFRGAEPLRTEDGIEVLPVEVFLAALENGTLFP